ncbi:hypothetical protein [Aureispira anguillae]|uniref:Uncharacterized protein n=1 Tax=Aureispira anguillae TaxID=2864201 RepID=A0A915YID5_9BACT|nr:hypothetical protein [Aureispira anguillae]BDS13753.1 hypothetical protein AsAng_0044940 [Aureispira anguillae]
MVFIHSHICPTNTSMLISEFGDWKAPVAIANRQGMLLGQDENAKLANSSDFSSFNNYKLHLHYERS